MGADTAARGADDAGALERRTDDEYRLTDNGDLCWRASGTAEVHAQVAMAVIVRLTAKTVGRKGAQRYDQRKGRDDRDQSITAKTFAQGSGATCRGNKEA